MEKGWKLRRKEGKLWKGGWKIGIGSRKSYKKRFFFCFSLLKTTEICFGSTKIGIFYREKHFTSGKHQEKLLCPLRKICLLRPCWYLFVMENENKTKQNEEKKSTSISLMHRYIRKYSKPSTPLEKVLYKRVRCPGYWPLLRCIIKYPLTICLIWEVHYLYRSWDKLCMPRLCFFVHIIVQTYVK